jgi:mannose-1-phosphate guanylyltransferase
MKNTDNAPVRCAIILAGGEGRRLRPFIQRLRGDALPKQYVNFIGTRSMLEHTYHRAEKLITPENLFTVVTKNHLKYDDVYPQLSNRPKGTVIIQPENKDTGPGLLLPLMHLIKRYPESVVVIFPSDHFIVEEDLFMGHVDLACRVVERDASLLVLLGVEPYGPEPEYGYILPDGKMNRPTPSGICRVSRFIEKPGPHVARELVQRGGLWNTLVMAFKAKTILDLVRRAVPVLYQSFQLIGRTLGTAREMDVVDEAYRKMEPLNFSKELLEILPIQGLLRLSVLPVRGVFWSDWGSERRILSDVQKFRYEEGLYGLGRSDINRFSLQA